MSVATRRAIYGKLAGDSTLNALLGTPATGYTKSIYYEDAPTGAGFPYIIFNKQAGTPRYAMAANAMDTEVWLIKGVDKMDKARTLSADGVDNISSRLDALLTDAALSISGKTQLYLRRDSDLDYAEITDGATYRHAGSNFRLIYQS